MCWLTYGSTSTWLLIIIIADITLLNCNFLITIQYISFLYIISAVKLFTINRIQNKSLCSHRISVYFVYLLCIYKYSPINVYIFKKNYVMFIY